MSGEWGTERARATLRILTERITSGEWPVNSKIPTEAELVAELGVGRSTIREAVRSLANLGMLEPARSRGTFVRSRSPISSLLASVVDNHSMDDVLAVRRALEIEAATLAARTRTEADLDALTAAHEADVAHASSPEIERGITPGQFHALLYQASGNPLLVDLLSGLMAAIRDAAARGEITPRLEAEDRHRDHARILAAIRDRDAERAGAHAAAHIDAEFVIATPDPRE